MKVHNKLFQFECSICNTGFKTKLEIEQHEADHRLEKRNNSSICDKNLLNALNFNEPQQGHVRGSGVCEQSDKPIPNKDRLKEHVVEFIAKKGFKCEQCSKIFAKEQGLIKHQEIHEQKSDFVCTECGKAFSDTSRLVEHMESHKMMEHKCEK